MGRHGRHILTEADVHQIRKMLSIGVEQKDIANQYGVVQATISMINTRTNWSYL